MSYVDGFVLAVPTANKQALIDHAGQFDPIFLEYGATRVLECWGDDVPHGKQTDFYRAVAAREDETVVFSWVEWPSKAVRDDAMGKMMQDPRAMWESPTGALRPMADHKGSGLVAACELLAGLLSGGGTLQPGNPRAGGILNNMTTILIDPARLADMDWLRQEFDAMAGWIRSSPPATAGQPVQLAGEPERRQQRHERLQWGTGMAEAEWQGIVDAARRAGAQV